MLRSAVIVANGALPLERIARREIDSADFILAADGGANHLEALSIAPDAVIGDFDSINADVSEFILRIHAPDQNLTDLEKAVLHCRDAGYERITLLSATGDRLDHTFAALALVCKYGLRLVDNTGEAVCLRGPNKANFASIPRQIISLMPCGPVCGLTTTGLRWDLHNAAFHFAERDGTSNVATGGELSVSITSGYLIIYRHHVPGQYS